MRLIFLALCFSLAGGNCTTMKTLYQLKLNYIFMVVMDGTVSNREAYYIFDHAYVCVRGDVFYFARASTPLTKARRHRIYI